MKKYDLALIIIGIAILVVTIATIVLNGSPFDNQLKALDQQKIRTFDAYKDQIENYYSLQRRLPTSLTEAQSALSSNQPTLDPTIEYKSTSSTQYQLCSTFKTETNQQSDQYSKPVESGYLKNYHQAGYDCLEYIIPNYIINNQRTQPISEPAVFPVEE